MHHSFSFTYDGKKYNNCMTFPDGLAVTAKCEHYSEYDAMHWMLTFENTGSENSKIISDILDCDMLLDIPEHGAKANGTAMNDSFAKVVSMKGCIGGNFYIYSDSESSTEFSIEDHYLNVSESFHCESEGGRSSNFCAPFFRVSQKDMGYIIAIGWSGNWKADFLRTEDGVHVKAGLKNTNFYLKPGEKVRTASILVMKYDNGAENGQNKFRRVIKSCFSLSSEKGIHSDGITAFELWGGLPSHESVKRLEALTKFGIKYDYVWIDAGWYGKSSNCISAYEKGWAEYTGQWEINPHPHPNGMKDIRKACDDGGMKILLWFEPERAYKGTKMTVEHPEWFTEIGNNNLLLDFGNEDAWNYVFNMLCSYLDELPIDAVRWDANLSYEHYWKAIDSDDRIGIAEIKHIMGFYRMYDALYEKYPGIIIDNCSSGGRRIDIETLKRSFMICRSDYQCRFDMNPEVMQVHSTNASKFLPYTGTFCKLKNDTYALRSCYQSNIGFAYWNAIFQEMNDDELEWAKNIKAEFDSVYHYFAYDFYNHGSDRFDTTSWCIWQYNSPEENEGMIMAFRRSNSPFDRSVIELRGLDDDAKYEFCDLDSKASFVMTGTDAKKFIIEIANKYESKIITYRKV